MTALDKKDLHVHTPFCPHRHTDAPLEAYLAAAERAGMAEVAFTEHAPLPIPLERTQYEENPNLSATGWMPTLPVCRPFESITPAR